MPNLCRPRAIKWGAGTLRPVRLGPASTLWWAVAISGLGDQTYQVGLSWVLASKFGSVGAYLFVMQQSAAFLMAAGGGALVAGRAPVAVLKGLDLARGAALIALYALTILRGYNLLTLSLAAVLLGSCRSLYRPVLRSIVPTICRDRQDASGFVASLETAIRGTALIGPVLAVVLVVRLSGAAFIMANAATFLLSYLLLIRLGELLPLGPVQQSGTPKPRLSLAQLRAGIRIASRRKTILYVALSSGPITGFWYYSLWLGLPIALNRHSAELAGLSEYGLAIALYGTSNVGTSLLIPRILVLSPRRRIVAGNLLMGLGITCMGVATLEPWHALREGMLYFGAAMAGCGGPLEQVTANVEQVRHFEGDEIASIDRVVLAGNNLCVLATMALAALVAHLPPSACVVMAGASIAAIGLFGAWFTHEEGRAT